MEKAKAYIKNELSVGKQSSPPSDKPPPATAAAAVTNSATADDEPRVCYVCGVVGFNEQYRIRVKPDAQVSFFLLS